MHSSLIHLSGKYSASIMGQNVTRFRDYLTLSFVTCQQFWNQTCSQALVQTLLDRLFWILLKLSHTLGPWKAMKRFFLFGFMLIPKWKPSPDKKIGANYKVLVELEWSFISYSEDGNSRGSYPTIPPERQQPLFSPQPNITSKDWKVLETS